MAFAVGFLDNGLPSIPVVVSQKVGEVDATGLQTSMGDLIE